MLVLDDVLEDVGESALRQAAVQRHLAALESALLAETGAGVLAFVPACRGLAVPRPHAAADPLTLFLLPRRGPQSTEVHKISLLP